MSKIAVEDGRDGKGAYRSMSGGLWLALLIPPGRFADQFVIEIER